MNSWHLEWEGWDIEPGSNTATYVRTLKGNEYERFWSDWIQLCTDYSISIGYITFIALTRISLSNTVKCLP